MKTKVIYIYGAPAVGKLTTAKALSEINKFKVFHNHLAADLVRSVFERGTNKADMYIVKLRFEMLELAVQENIDGMIMTGAHAHDFLYPNGENDEWYIKELQKITESNGGEFYGINLHTSENILMKRVTENSRLDYGKIQSADVLEDVLQKNDYTKTAPIHNNLRIDNTDVTAAEVAQLIIDFIK